MKNTVNMYRGNLIECSHKAHIAVVDINKNLIAYHGNPQEVIYARSSVKPIQAIQVLESGACEKYNRDRLRVFAGRYRSQIAGAEFFPRE